MENNNVNPTPKEIRDTFLSMPSNAEQVNSDVTLDDIEAELKAELRVTTDSKRRKAIELDLKRIPILKQQQKIVDMELKKATSTKYTFGRDENESEIDNEALKNAKSEFEAEMIIEDAKKKKKRKKKEQEFNELPDEFVDLKVDAKQVDQEIDARSRGGHDRGERTR